MDFLEMADWLLRNRDRLERLRVAVQAEVDRRIANHPDLAELDDLFDDICGP
jgi:hypothetical protein